MTREPQEVFDYVDTARAAEILFQYNQNPFAKEDRRFMFEGADNDLDNWDRENQAIHSADPGDDFDEHLLESDDENMDPGVTPGNQIQKAIQANQIQTSQLYCAQENRQNRAQENRQKRANFIVSMHVPL